MKPLFLRLHRWLTLFFAAPMAVLTITGLILSFEPVASTVSRTPGLLTADRVEALLAEHDPQGQARGLAFRSYDGALSIMGGPTIDVTTGQARAPGALATVFFQARMIHERLLFGLGWLVTASTIAMCAIIALGFSMGLPAALRQSASGWHKGTAWFLSPLVALAPLTGLALAFGITFSGSPGAAGPTAPPPVASASDPSTTSGAPSGEAPRGERRGGRDGSRAGGRENDEGRRAPAMSLREAARLVGRDHDLSNLIWLRSRGPNLLARLEEGGEAKVYMVRADSLTSAPRNVPRLMHEGNWAGVWSGLINALACVALAILLTTGLIIWARRAFRTPQRRRERAAS